MKVYSLTQTMLALWYRVISEGLDSHSPQTELGSAFVDDLIIAVLQHEVLLTRACMYVGCKDQDDRQRQMNILSKDLHEVSKHDAFLICHMFNVGPVCMSHVLYVVMKSDHSDSLVCHPEMAHIDSP